MKVCTCVILFGIFAYTNSTTRNRTKAHRSVNPENENVSELSSEEYSGHTIHVPYSNIFDNVYKFIARETTASVKHKKHVFRAALTGFIQDAVSILNTYEDTAFEDFFHILDTEIRKYHYRDCKFSELMQNQDTRSLLATALKIIRGKSVSFTKENINKLADIMREETYGNDVKKLLDYINSLYTHTEQGFHRVLNELTHYRKMKSIKAHRKLIKVIRQGVRDILFDYYTELDSNTRRELKERIEKFWKQHKKNPASSAEVNENHKMNDAIISSSNVSENVINEAKDPKYYPKNDPQTNLRNKSDRKSMEIYYQQSQDKETEKDDSSFESEKRNTDTDTPDEISSGQSFDSSSNSIKESQERHAEYNAERYMTLYTERISYKSRTTKQREIIPKNATFPSRPTTTSTPSYSFEDESVGSNKVDVLRFNHNPNDIEQDISNSDRDTESVSKQSQERHAEYNSARYISLYTEKESYKSRTTKKTEIISKSANLNKDTKKVDVLSTDQDFDDTKQDVSESGHDTESDDKILMVKSKPVPRARLNDDKRQKHGKSKSKSKHKNTHFIGEYNAVIDVQLANTELLNSLGIFQPVLDSNFRYGNISYQRSVLQTKSIPTRPTIQFQRMRAGAETKSIKPAFTKPPSRYSKTQESIYLNRLSNTRRNKLTLLPEDDNFIRQQKQKYLKRRNANDTDLNVPKNFNEYVIQRLDTLEKDLKDFRSMLYDNRTREAEVNNVTDKYEAKNKIENKRKHMNVVSLKIENHDLNKENNDGQSITSDILNTESSTNNTSVIEKNTLYVTVIDNKNTSQVTSINVNNNKEINKDQINNRETTVTVNGSVKVTESMEFEPFETTPKPTPIDYSNIRYQLDHINDGLDLRM